MVFGSGFDFPPPTTLFLATIHTDPPWNDGLDAPMSCGRNLGRSRDGLGLGFPWRKFTLREALLWPRAAYEWPGALCPHGRASACPIGSLHLSKPPQLRSTHVAAAPAHPCNAAIGNVGAPGPPTAIPDVPWTSGHRAHLECENVRAVLLCCRSLTEPCGWFPPIVFLSLSLSPLLSSQTAPARVCDPGTGHPFQIR